MQRVDKLNLMIAQAPRSGWGQSLERALSALPLDLHWSATAIEAIELVVNGGMHLAVVGDQLPDAGGLETLRRLRRVGAILPCVLVCRQCDHRLLRDALELGAYSVVDFDRQAEFLAPVVINAMQRVYHVELRRPNGLN